MGGTMDVFQMRDKLIGDYREYIASFINISDDRIRTHVSDSLDSGALWPDPLIQLNPSFEPGEYIDELVSGGTLHAECSRVFSIKREPDSRPERLRLHRHQAEAIRTARQGHNYVLTTGTGSGKSLAYIVPIVDYVLRTGSGGGIKAIVVYPMNALANSQERELGKFLKHGYPDGKGPVTFAKYTGQESDAERQEIMAHPPDILLTNYVMLELILTRPIELPLIKAAQGLRFLVLDELHTYRGRQGADVALLVRRVRDRMDSPYMQTVGTSATLAGVGSFDAQRKEVSVVATRLFGAEVRPEHVIGETLRRTTPERGLDDPSFLSDLSRRVADVNLMSPHDHPAFAADPLCVWIESEFGVTTEPESGRLIRRNPQTLLGEHGAATRLSVLTGHPPERCADAIREALLAGYNCTNPETGFPTFAFRLHQFISRGDAVYASLEEESARYITLHRQEYKPGSRPQVLLPLVFCRECGQEYFCVRQGADKESGLDQYLYRDIGEMTTDADGKPGFLYYSSANPWPMTDAEILNRLPDDWLEDDEGAKSLASARRKDLPQFVQVGTDGRETDSPEAIECHFIPAPFRFCLNCGVSYDSRQRNDFAKLALLSSEGRSTATTILSLSAVRNLRHSDLPKVAQKVLSFTDNRQDASLQAGHFNDFVEVGLLRSALYRAVRDAGEGGLRHEQLTQAVFSALALPVEEYANDPEVRFQGRQDLDRALRDVLGYRLYRDLKRGWRITSPNLEQCGLLEIQYLSLDELCEAEDVWQGMHPSLANATPQVRAKISKVLLDYMRRELAIKVDYLDQPRQERLLQQSNQHLISPWALDEQEALEYASILYPRPRKPKDSRTGVYLSARGGFGQYLRRPNTFSEGGKRLGLEGIDQVIKDLLAALRAAGLVNIVHPAEKEGDVPGYQLTASAMLWAAGDGTKPFHDPIRVPRVSLAGGRTNPYFIEFYQTAAANLHGMQAREHTAQVPYESREEREEKFREGKLPLLYCSPTMELGVDISELNVVNMRNIPPTPANYAQRSGRAGRSGQPALVFSYCTTGSPHDQYFFRHPRQMVSGQVAPPRIDLANEDLVRSHVYAIWLAETGQRLGNSVKELLDMTGDEPSLDLLPDVRDTVESTQALQRARTRAQRVLATVGDELSASDWYSDGWLDEVLTQVVLQFDKTVDRWRSLYRAARKQFAVQNRIIGDATRSQIDKDIAKRLRREAESQLELLAEVAKVVQSDFYSYRYFASEGFLPGYSFPRLPVSAFVPARRVKQGDEFLSRPRFLAISEFGPRSIIYHEGSRYIINKVILPVGEEDSNDGKSRLALGEAKLCAACGYVHPVGDGRGPDLCERCGVPLDAPLRKLFRMQNVSTKRRDKISSDEEERTRLGYELMTGVRFGEQDGRPSYRNASVTAGAAGAAGEEQIASLNYGHTATIWRINLGWARRKNKAQYGFVLDVERGYWSSNDEIEDEDLSDPMSPSLDRVVPYVEDRRNCLIFDPATPLEPQVLISLQSALKNAIQVVYQLEDSELAVETLPTRDEPRVILFYESAEGGAGVLRRLLDDPAALARVARQALELCHFDPETGEDRHHAPHATEDCESACYDCLMSYGNQREHRMLDRKAILDILMQLSQAKIDASPAPTTRAEHLEMLMRVAGSELEKKWLRRVEELGLRLPASAQAYIEACQTRPDYLYDGEHLAAIYVDGPIHTEYEHRRQRDVAQTEMMEDYGYVVIRFRHDEDWDSLFARYGSIFGKEN